MVGDIIVRPLGLKVSYISQCMSFLHQPWLIPKHLNLVLKNFKWFPYLHLVATYILRRSCVMFQRDVVGPTNMEENNTLRRLSAMVLGIFLEVG